MKESSATTSPFPTLTEQQRSVLICAAMGWWADFDLDGCGHEADWFVNDADGVYICEATSFRDGYMPNLYEKENWGLAWRAHMWAVEGAQYRIRTREDRSRFNFTYSRFWDTQQPWRFQDGPKRWLDQILKLCIGSKLVTQGSIDYVSDVY